MLINCVVYQNGTKLADIPVAEISEYLARPDTFVWVAMQDATTAELDEMQHEFGLHELAVEDARHGHQRPKDAVVDRYFPIIDALETELETIEADIFTKRTARANIERLYDLKRHAMVLKHAVAPLLEGTSKLYGGRVPSICVGVKDYFRDVVDHLSRINALIDTMRETIGTAIQVNLAMATIEESEVMKRLAAWASIFAVSTSLAGIWGMNFENMPELKWRYGYLVALGTIVVSCSLLYWRFRRARWL